MLRVLIYIFTTAIHRFVQKYQKQHQGKVPAMQSQRGRPTWASQKFRKHKDISDADEYSPRDRKRARDVDSDSSQD